MKYTQLGRAGVKVSRLCLGTMNFGPRTDERESFRIMDRALELGINFFDTANRYGMPNEVGLTESIIGRWLAQGGGRREGIVLATKVYGPMGEGPNDMGNSAYHIRAACEDSLRRLQTDHVDLYQMHHIDKGRPHPKASLGFLGGDPANLGTPPHIRPGTPWEEIWQAMGKLVADGKAIYVGSSNFAGWNIAQANERAATLGLLGLVTEQSVYSLARRTVELEVVPACRAYGVGIIPWSPLAGGMLAGSVRSSEGGRRSGLSLNDEQQRRLTEYESLCHDLGEEPANVALAWLLSNPVVTAPIVGPRTVEQLNAVVRATEIQLSPETIGELERIWPGPGGEAPEAYAW
jgi:aryl-alcohol dehydrogenase-like predicted oxidoreductase